jgi:hypothetical protein
MGSPPDTMHLLCIGFSAPPLGTTLYHVVLSCFIVRQMPAGYAGFLFVLGNFGVAASALPR